MRWKIALVLCVVAGFGYLWAVRQRLTWMGDDGFLTVQAGRVLRGQVPYRDAHFHSTPGAVYLLAGAQALSDSWNTSRGLWVALVMLQGAGVFLLVHRLTRSPLLASTGFLLVISPAALNPLYSHHHVSAVVVLGTTLAWWLWIRTGRFRFAAIAGVVDALLFWTSHNKGGLMGLASLLILALAGPASRGARWRSAGLYAASGAAVSVVPFVLLWSSGALPDFWRDCFGLLSTGYAANVSVPYGTTLTDPGARGGVWQIARKLYSAWYSLGPPVALVAETILFARRRAQRPWTGVLMIQGWALWACALHRPDLDHLLYVTHPPTALLLIQVYHLRSAWRRIGLGVAAGFGVAAAGFMLLHVYRTTTRPRFAIETSRDRAWTPTEELALTVHRLDGAVPSGEPLFVYPYGPMYNRLLDRHNPTRYDLLIPGFVSPDQMRECVTLLERLEVRYVLVDTTQNREWFRRIFPRSNLDPDAGPIPEYIRAKYEAVLTLPCATLYRRITR